jgi:hypothetical protein
MKGRKGIKIIKNAGDKTDNKRMEKEWDNKEEYQKVLFTCLGSGREIAVL